MSGLDPSQFKAQVIRPSLLALSNATSISFLWSPAAETLLLGTALQESALTYLVQLGDASGRGGHGLYQDEPGDLADLLRNFIATRAPLRDAVNGYRSGGDDVKRLETDLTWASWICRLHYYRSPTAMPAANDLAAMCEFYKADYNTPLGAAEPQQILASFTRAFATA